MRSAEGPKLAIGDVNNDGEDDIYMGASKNNPGTLFIQKNNTFIENSKTTFEKQKASEDSQSVFFDADGDKDLDLYVSSGGVEFSKYSPQYLDKLYINDGKGNFEVSNQKLPKSGTFHSSSVVLAEDIDNDGDIDLFVGERTIPNYYGNAGSGFILINDGKGNFSTKNETALQNIGMITDALFIDIDDDTYKDLIVIGEFMGIEIFKNQKGTFKKTTTELSELKGWWNTIEKADLDDDGDLDLIIGNHGLNSRFKASASKPIILYVGDYDKNGYSDPILTFTSDNDKQYPYALRHNLIDQLKYLTKKFPDYETFKSATIQDILTESQLEESLVLKANTLSTLVVLNEGGFKFKTIALPFEAQLAPIYAITTSDFDKDGDQDIVLGGNLHGVKPEFGRYDATYGIYLENLGNVNFKYHNNGNGFHVNGEIRDLKILKNKLYVSKNNDSLEVFKY